MYALMAALDGVRDFMALGGTVLTLIACLLLLMWTLIFERTWYFKTTLKGVVHASIDAWQARPDRISKRARQVREAMLSRVNAQIDDNMAMIATLVALAPLFGLLGTVTGMIEVFDIMGISAGGDARSMANGVFKATIPTMAGMVAAISGVIGNTYLTRIASREKMLLEDHLALDH